MNLLKKQKSAKNMLAESWRAVRVLFSRRPTADSHINTRHYLSLNPGEVHLWVVDSSGVDLHPLLPAYRKILSVQERAQENKFRFEYDRLHYILARVLVRTVLSRYLPLRPEEWVFAANSYGRPEIANAVMQGCGLCFSLSHSGNLVVLGVTVGAQLGVDVENMCRQVEPMELARHCFSPAEVASLAVQSDLQRQVLFFEYWTLKEAYVKAVGVGLAMSLDSFSVSFPTENTIHLVFSPQVEAKGDSARWRLQQFRLSQNYILSICAERISQQALEVISRRLIPFAEEEEIVLEPVRRSVC